MKAITRNELLEALRLYGKAAAKRPAGDGWYTLDELAAQEGKGTTRATIRYRMQTAQRRGIVFETAIGTALDAEGNAKRSYYYRLVKNGKP